MKNTVLFTVLSLLINISANAQAPATPAVRETVFRNEKGSNQLILRCDDSVECLNTQVISINERMTGAAEKVVATLNTNRLRKLLRSGYGDEVEVFPFADQIERDGGWWLMILPPYTVIYTLRLVVDATWSIPALPVKAIQRHSWKKAKMIVVENFDGKETIHLRSGQVDRIRKYVDRILDDSKNRTFSDLVTES